MSPSLNALRTFYALEADTDLIWFKLLQVNARRSPFDRQRQRAKK
jgi:hypothetical protein